MSIREDARKPTRSTDEVELVNVFHGLLSRGRGFTGLSPREEGVLRLIRDLLEPPRAPGASAPREPVRLCVNRPATVAARGRLMGGSAVVIGLRRVELVTPEPLRLGEPVAISIAGRDRRSWFAFHGRVVRCRRGGNGTTVALLSGPRPAP